MKKLSIFLDTMMVIAGALHIHSGTYHWAYLCGGMLILNVTDDIIDAIKGK